MPRLVGPSTALDLLFSSRVVLAEEALTLGLVNRVYPPDELLAATIAYAADLAANCSPTAMAAMKRQVWIEQPLAVAEDEAKAMMKLSFAHPDFKEGLPPSSTSVRRRLLPNSPTGRGARAEQHDLTLRRGETPE